MLLYITTSVVEGGYRSEGVSQFYGSVLTRPAAIDSYLTNVLQYRRIS